jgi:hypothetical protein
MVYFIIELGRIMYYHYMDSTLGCQVFFYGGQTAFLDIVTSCSFPLPACRRHGRYSDVAETTAPFADNIDINRQLLLGNT